MSEPQVAVVYLLRKGNPDAWFQAFLESVARHPGGMSYLPVVIHKGYEPGDIHPLVANWTDGGPAPLVLPMSDEGFALTAFRTAASAVSTPRILFLTSYSRMLANDWLAKLVAASDQLGPGAAVGATGSWEALDESTPFPNICLRTTGFLIERLRYLAFPHALESRYDGNLFEAGPNNMTRTILAESGKVAVVDRDGRVIAPRDWPESLTFRSGNQQRLLIADNRTHDYQTAGGGRRKRRAARAFGDLAMVTREPIWRRWRVGRAWKKGAPLPDHQ